MPRLFNVHQQYKNWCFTLNNYTDDDVTRLSTPNEAFKYMLFGKEIAPDTGTPHLQGFAVCSSKRRLNQIRDLIGDAHLEPAASCKRSIIYCKKEGDFVEWGDAPWKPGERRGRQGDRSEIEDLMKSVDEGTKGLKELRKLHPDVVAKYPRFVRDYIRDTKEEYLVPTHPLRDWQATLNEELRRPPNERSIHFIVDTTGNTGKSWFSHYYAQLHEEETQVIIPGKKADMAYALDESKKVFFFDCPRAKNGDFIQYDFLEEVKNGYVFSPKYESTLKRFAPPHVVVMMNETPDMTKLSADRYHITNI